MSLPRPFRILSTGLCFLLFSTGSVVLTWTVLPLTTLAVRNPARRQRTLRFLVRRFFGFMTWSISALGCMRLRVEGEHLLAESKGMLVLANHPTLIDVVVLMSRVPQASCVIKSALFRRPGIGSSLRAAGYIENAGADALVRDCAAALSRDEALFIFPEGTRSIPGTPLSFQRGTAHVLLANPRPFMPVLVTCLPATLMKGQPWFRVPERRFDLTIRVLPPVFPSEWMRVVEGKPRPLAARELTRYLEFYFTNLLDSTV
jgi:1-acyl-sn-glycerol-3-phosphate acyltransferase